MERSIPAGAGGCVAVAGVEVAYERLRREGGAESDDNEEDEDDEEDEHEKEEHEKEEHEEEEGEGELEEEEEGESEPEEALNLAQVCHAAA